MTLIPGVLPLTCGFSIHSMHLYFLSDGSHSRSTLEQGKQQKIKQKTAKQRANSQKCWRHSGSTCPPFWDLWIPNKSKNEPWRPSNRAWRLQNQAPGISKLSSGVSWERLWSLLGGTLGERLDFGGFGEGPRKPRWPT